MRPIPDAATHYASPHAKSSVGACKAASFMQIIRRVLLWVWRAARGGAGGETAVGDADLDVEFRAELDLVLPGGAEQFVAIAHVVAQVVEGRTADGVALGVGEVAIGDGQPQLGDLRLVFQLLFPAIDEARGLRRVGF